MEIMIYKVSRKLAEHYRSTSKQLDIGNNLLEVQKLVQEDYLQFLQNSVREKSDLLQIIL